MIIEEFKKLLDGKKEESEKESVEAKIEKLIAKLKKFQKEGSCPLDPVERIKRGFCYFLDNIYDPTVAKGQEPKFLVFSCSDSRVSPTNILSFQPGEAFMARNIANLVPPFNQLRYSGVGAMIEYAVGVLKVENILIIGHSDCGGIHALMDLPEDGSTSNDFIDDWVKIGLPAKAKVLAENGHLDPCEQRKICEKEAVNLSLVNLQSYPYVRTAMANKSVGLWGGYYNFFEATFELWEVKYQTDHIPVICCQD
ncbi:Carbonic anhydrase [Euphorbia peplus]|nr:Carbonic anhydrase [Euphorbia peplus]